MSAHTKIVDVLGAGGMGVVYKARDLHRNLPVAFKVLRSGEVTPERRAFRRRAQHRP